MIFWLPAPLVNILSNSGIDKVDEKILMDLFLVALVFHHISEIGWSTFGSSDYFTFSDFATGTVHK